RAFIPSPKVDVAVVHFLPLVKPLIKCHFDLVEKVCRHIFHFRQKYCVRGVETLYPPEQRTAMADQLLRRSRISPKVVPYNLSVEEIGCMCYVYEEQCKQNPGLFTYDYRAAVNKDVNSLPPICKFDSS
ncbi:unnamed protein product, partial [Soboliphyme baturini]|uniref:Dimethyladenosine transferase 1, mitochondrial n=1 Tax=Soboliphyme baturini TaxID=241478 RepID=A0A183IX16_9BILA